MAHSPEKKAGSRMSGQHITMQFAAFAFLGMAVGEPAAITAFTLSNLPGGATLEYIVGTSFVAVGVTMVARILWAPFLDAHNPPLLGHLGRRRGWVALLLAILAALAIAIGLSVPSSGLTPAPVYFGLMFAAMLVAGGLFAAVDALRSVQPSDRTHGILAVGQYAGVTVPTMVLDMVTKTAGNPVPGQSGPAISELWIMAGFLAAGWIGLWLLPGKDIKGGRIAELPRIRRLLASEVNLSAGGLRLVAWLYGVFICPVVDFFERHGKTALLAIVVLILSDMANNWATVRILNLYDKSQTLLYPNALALSAGVQSLESVVTVLEVSGMICGAALVLWLSPVRALAAALVSILVVILANTIAFLTAPALAPYYIAYLIDPFAGGALFIVTVAVIARLVTPRFAALQFCLLLVASLPTTMIKRIGVAAQNAIGILGTQMVFLVLAMIAIGLAVVLARRLDSDSPTTD